MGHGMRKKWGRVRDTCQISIGTIFKNSYMTLINLLKVLAKAPSHSQRGRGCRDYIVFVSDNFGFCY